MAESSKTEDHPEDLVVVGSSAGGVGALSTLVSTLHKSFPAPIVLAQHLDPQRPSQLGAILERRSTLPIVLVDEEGSTKLERGKIYVVPANQHVKISDGHVYLEADHAERPKPSVDLLLSSAAQAYGEHLIAVILTGAGSDGAAGAVDVKNGGGVVIIQNPETAAYPSMPLSLPPTAVDHVVDMEQIGPLLYDILKGVHLPMTEKADDPLRDLLAYVSDQSHIDFRNYKSSTILRRISRRMAVTHNPTIREYTDYLRTHPNEIQELVKAFLIKVTGFFRDPEAFDFLGKAIIPELIDRRRENGRTLRFWSAGCATGEEAYSLALLLADLLGSDFPEWNIKIFATDLAADAIAFARRGLYPENVLIDLPEHYRHRFFEPYDHGYRISKVLRQVVIFGQQDISHGVPFPRIDLVTCRNLLIYLKPELQQVVLDLFAYSLHQSNGYLFLGKAEAARPTKATFEMVNKKWKIYRCLSGPLAVPIHESSRPMRLAGTVWREQRPPQPATPAPHEGNHVDFDIAQLRRVNETMLRYTTVAVVIIDRSYRILTINAAARRLFAVREIAYDQDFLHTVQALPYHEVRRAIDTCFREQSTMTLQEVELGQPAESSSRYINFTIMAMQTDRPSPDLSVITAMDVTEQVLLKRKLEAVQHEHAQLVSELSAVNKRLTTMNKELQDANEELQAANEELMLTQEELQATNEEFEATNEELQATNEELETNNEELQATNEELQTTNDELTARTTELHQFTKHHLVEQQQLSTLLERFPHYVMVLNGEDLTIQALNPGYKQLLGSRNVIGLPIAEVFSGTDVNVLVDAIKTAVRQVQSVNTTAVQASVDNGGQNTDKFSHTMVPISDESGSTVSRVFVYSEKAE